MLLEPCGNYLIVCCASRDPGLFRNSSSKLLTMSSSRKEIENVRQQVGQLSNLFALSLVSMLKLRHTMQSGRGSLGRAPELMTTLLLQSNCRLLRISIFYFFVITKHNPVIIPRSWGSTQLRLGRQHSDKYGIVRNYIHYNYHFSYLSFAYAFYNNISPLVYG